MVARCRIKVAIPLLGVAFAATAGTAAANPVFSFSSQLSSPEGVMTFMGSNGSPIVTGRTVPVGITGAAEILTFGVVAKPGNLGSLSGVSALAPGALISGSLNAISDVALDNIKIIDPGVAAGTPVSYSINFEVRGQLAVAAFGTSNALAGVQLTYDFAPGSGLTLGDDVASTNPGNSGASGIFSSGVADVRAHTPIQTGFVDHDVFAEFILATHASVEAGPSLTEKGQASASADFLDPFSFPTNGPVFNFFDANGNPLTGVTVDSSDGCIVNNRFVCGGSGTSAPEPSTWALMLLGFAGLGHGGWRSGRKRRRSKSKRWFSVV